MTTVNDILRRGGLSVKDKPGRFGIEIETETPSGEAYPEKFLVPFNVDEQGHQTYTTPLSLWNAKSDGSLRNFGIEYVMKNPLSFEGTKGALKEFKEALGTVPFLLEQPSTSVHVHMNVGTETPLVLANLSTTWFLFENLLLDFSGPTRRSNLFALGARLAEEQICNFTKMFKSIESGLPDPFAFHQQHVKYAALNLGTIKQFGSLEARSFKGTTDIEEILVWLGILNNLFEFSKQPGLTPGDILSSYLSKGLELISDVFGPYSTILKCDGYPEMIERNETYVYSIVTSVKNWNTFGLAYETIQPKKRKKLGTSFEEQQQLYEMLISGNNPFGTIDTSPGAIPASWANTLNLNAVATTIEDEDF